LDTLPLVDLKLKGVRASSQRARVAFFIALLSACSITVVLYNEHLAFCRRLLDEGRGFTQWPPPQSAASVPAVSAAPGSAVAAAVSPPRDSAGELSKEKRVEVIKNWEDRTNIRLDLLGINLGSADLTFFGSIAMLVVSIYYCLCARRANYEVRSLVEDVSQSKDEKLNEYVLAGIRQSLVLTLVTEKQYAVSADATSSPRLIRLIGFVLSVFTYFPTIAVAAIILGDVQFAFLRGDVPSRLWVLRNLHAEYLIQFIVLDLLALAFMVFVWQLNRLTNRFQEAAGATIQNMASRKPEGGAAGAAIGN